jgi:hypothetical protein
MASDDRFVVYDGMRDRDPANALRIVSEDGHAFHVITEDGLRKKQTVTGTPSPFAEAVMEAFRRAGRPLPVDANA